MKQEQENLYVSRMTVFINDTMSNITYNAIEKLRKLHWQENTKPQHTQLDVVVKGSEALDSLWENYFLTHLKILRKFNLFCPLSLEYLNNFQIYRKKGFIAMLKKIDPNLGKVNDEEYYFDAASGRVKKRLKKGEEKPKDIIVDDDPNVPEKYMGNGIFDEDWMWVQYQGRVMKVPIYENRGNKLAPLTIKQIGHLGLEKLAKEHEERHLRNLEIKQQEIEEVKRIQKRNEKPIPAAVNAWRRHAAIPVAIDEPRVNNPIPIWHVDINPNEEVPLPFQHEDREINEDDEDIERKVWEDEDDNL